MPPKVDRDILYKFYVFWLWQYTRRNSQYISDYDEFASNRERHNKIKEKLQQRGITTEEANKYTEAYNNCKSISEKYNYKILIDYRDGQSSKDILDHLITNKKRENPKQPLGFNGSTYFFPQYSIMSGQSLFAGNMPVDLSITKDTVTISNFYESDIESIIENMRMLYYRRAAFECLYDEPADLQKTSKLWVIEQDRKKKYNFCKWEDAAHAAFKNYIKDKKINTTSSMARAIGLLLWDIAEQHGFPHALKTYEDTYHSPDQDKYTLHIDGYTDSEQLRKLCLKTARCIKNREFLPIS